MKHLKIIFYVFIVIILVGILYYGIPSGRENVHMEVLSTERVSAYAKGLSKSFYTANLKLDSGDIITIKSSNPRLLKLQDGYIELETHYSLILFKTIYAPTAPY